MNHRLISTLVSVACAAPVMGASWPMKHRDPAHTGRADYTVPAERMNNTFFDTVR
jgi:hypothetical protein